MQKKALSSHKKVKKLPKLHAGRNWGCLVGGRGGRCYLGDAKMKGCFSQFFPNRVNSSGWSKENKGNFSVGLEDKINKLPE